MRRVPQRGERTGPSWQVEGERLLATIPRGEVDVEPDAPRAEARAETHPHRRVGPVQVSERYVDRVPTPRGLGPVEIEVLRVLPAASFVPRAVLIEMKPARRRPRPLVGHALALRCDHDQVDVRRAGPPSDDELQQTRLQPAPLVDDPVAVVVYRVEAELGSSGGAGFRGGCARRGVEPPPQPPRIQAPIQRGATSEPRKARGGSFSSRSYAQVRVEGG